MVWRWIGMERCRCFGSVCDVSSFTPHLCRCVGCDRVVARGGTVLELRLPHLPFPPESKAKAVPGIFSCPLQDGGTSAPGTGSAPLAMLYPGWIAVIPEFL